MQPLQTAHSTPMNTIPSHIATKFLAEISSRFNMPEFKRRKFRPNTRKRFPEGTLTAVADVTPTGQMALLVRSLQVFVSVSPHHIPNVLRGTVEMYYEHHNGGSNGHDTEFFIATRNNAIDDVEYVGIADWAACQIVFQSAQ